MFCRFRQFLVKRNAISESLQLPDSTDFIRLVRWRKRRWAPIPASKLYYVRKPTPWDEEEKKELLIRDRIYATQMRSLRKFIMEAAIAEHDAEHQALAQEQLQKEKENIIAINERWNEETRVIREARVAERQRLKDEALALAMEEREAKRAQRAEAARAKVIKTQSLVPTFVDMDDLEQEIDQALNTRVSYNWGIDKDGKRYVESPDGSIEIKDLLETPAAPKESLSESPKS